MKYFREKINMFKARSPEDTRELIKTAIYLPFQILAPDMTFSSPAFMFPLPRGSMIIGLDETSNRGQGSIQFNKCE